MEKTAHSPADGDANLKSGTNRSGAIAPIWNPNAAANWSLLFSPAFGSYIHMLNWKSLGQPAKAASAKVWFYLSLLVMTAVVALNVVLPDQTSGAANGLGFLYLLLWYFLAGRSQAKFVKQEIGNEYSRKPWGKPLLIGLVGFAGFSAIGAAATVVIVAQLGKASGREAGNSGAPVTTVPQATVATAETTSQASESVAALATAPNCAAAEVKEIITDNYAGELAATGIPDLMMAIERDRVKLRVEMISEVKRNVQSQNVQCSGKLVVEFPKEDLDRAARSDEAKNAQLIAPGFAVPSNSVFDAILNYTVSLPADKEEMKDGPIVKMSMRDGESDGEKLGRYIASYTMLAYATPDISPSSKNDRKWAKEWKEASVQECAKQSNLQQCQCKMDQFETALSQDEMHRISYSVQTNPALMAKYPNFVQFAQKLNKQCSL